MNVTHKEAVVLQWLRMHPFATIEVHISNGQPARLFIKKSTLLKENDTKQRIELADVALNNKGKVSIESKKNGVTQVITEQQVIIEIDTENTAFELINRESMIYE